MKSNNDLALISALDLASIKKKLMHAESGEGWSRERANATECEYRRFLYLLKVFPTEQVAPLADVDTFWHYHILDTMKYARDCKQAFGYFVHYCPDFGLDEENAIAARQETANRTRELYESSFGESYDRTPGGATHKALCISATPCTGKAAGAQPDAGKR